MRKKFGLINTMFWGLLIFMLLSMSNVHAATLNWGTADPFFNHSVNINGMVPFPSGTIQKSNEYSYTGNQTVGAINQVANVVSTPESGVTLMAKAYGSIIQDGVSSSAFVSFDFPSGYDSAVMLGPASTSNGGFATSWIKRTGLTVNENGLFDLKGSFVGSITYDDSNGIATHCYYGGVILEERAGSAVTSSVLNQSWTLSIDDMMNGTEVWSNILLRPVDDNEESLNYGKSLYYDLKVGFIGINGLGAFIETWPMGGVNISDSIYELGNEGTPLSINGSLTSQVPLPGTIMLLFSGIAGLFGFKLSLLRRGSSNN